MNDSVRPLVDRDDRRRAVEDIDHSFCVEAGAGTGKTTLLIDRFMSIITGGRAGCSQVVAITFTEKAAGEMKFRLRSEIERRLRDDIASPASRERLVSARRDLERAPISTIHAFAASLLREHPVESGVDPRFIQLDAPEASLFLDESWNEFLAHAAGPGTPAVRRFLALGGRAGDLRSMADEIYYRRGERYTGGIFGDEGAARASGAGAGSGRSGGSGRGPTGHAVRAFRDAVLEAAGRLSVLADEDCVDHGDLGYIEIKGFLDVIEAGEGLEGEDLEEFLLTLDLPRAKGRKSSWAPPDACAEQKRIITGLRSMQEGIRRLESNGIREELSVWFDEFLDFVEKRKRESGFLDFDDLLIRTRELLRNREALSRLRRRFRYILVDEFQDTDPLQAEIVFLLAGDPENPEGIEPHGGRLFIVGDPKQSIYRFRKADVEIYEMVKERLEGSGSHLRINQNFRSVPGITGWINEFFGEVIRPPESGRYQPRYEPIHPRREGEERAVALLDLELGEGVHGADEVRRTEGQAAARLVAFLVSSGRRVMDTVTRESRELRYRDIAVIYPGTTGIDYYEEPLRSEGIPYMIEGGKLYYARQEIRDLASCLWAVEDPWDALALLAALRSPLFGFSDEEIFLFVREGGKLNYQRPELPKGGNFRDFGAACAFLAELHRRRNERGPSGTLLELLRGTNFMELSLVRPHGEQRILNIRKAVQRARDFEAKLRSYRRFARWFRDQEVLEAAEGESPLVEEEEDAVRLLTVHKSKGLQFPVVILVNLVQQRTRSSKIIVEKGKRLAFRVGGIMETTDYGRLIDLDRLKDEAEAARLLYVAATRAGDLLVIPRTPKKGSYFSLLEKHLPGEGGGGSGEERRISGPAEAGGVAGSRVLEWRLSDLPGLGRPSAAFVKFPEAGREESERTRRNWLAAREKLLESGKTASLVVTPSGMEMGARTKRDGLREAGPVPAAGGPESDRPGLLPRLGYAGPGIGLEELAGSVRSGGEEGRTLRFGTAFHRIMEIVGFGKVPHALVAAVAAEHGLPEEDTEELADLACRALSSDLLKGAAGAARAFREVPFTVPLEEDREDSKGAVPPLCHYIEGRIDLLFELDGRWTAVDYKTDDVTAGQLDERLEIYKVQGGLYAAALKRLGIDPKEIVFYFVRPDLVRSLEVSEHLLDYSEAMLKRWICGRTPLGM